MHSDAGVIEKARFFSEISGISNTKRCGGRDLNPSENQMIFLEDIKSGKFRLEMRRPGFEPGSSARKAEMIGQTTL